jgi:hypothetical protein
MGTRRAVQAVRELVRDGRSSTLALFDLDPAGDARALAELASTLLHQLSAAHREGPPGAARRPGAAAAPGWPRARP